MADIQLRSIQQILGAMVARLLALTDINDVSPGSIAMTILEAAAASDFALEAKLLQLLNLRNIDKASGIDLENLAFEQGITPSRIGSSSAKAIVTIKETGFTKVSSNIYAGSTAPVAGDTSIRVVSGSAFNPTGTIFIGRGTQTSEQVTYLSVIDNGSFWTINLASPLSKDHLAGEQVVMGQGGNRIVSTGTVVLVQGAPGVPSVEFATQVDYVIPDGEDTLSNVTAIATQPGSGSNVGRNKITQFQSPPWSTASVTNENPATGGRDAETDVELRQRIKDHIHTLSGGTERAIIRAVIGAFDDEENKRVGSAYLRRPTANVDSSILFIDDGTGFQPIFSGVGEEVIVTSAAGTESFFQLQKAPLVKGQVASVGTEPFNLTGIERLFVEVDGESEEKAIPGQDFRTPGIVSAQEAAESINKTFTSVEARAKDGQLFLTPTANDPDYIRVGSAVLGADANAVLRFPTRKQYTIRLYLNDRLLEKKGAEALIQSLQNSQWTGLGASETLQLNIDDIDSPIVSFTNLDFATYTSSSTIASATVADWVTMINRKFIGVTAIGRDDGTFVLKSNRGFSSLASIQVIGGSLATKLFPENAISEGKSPEFKINRLLGQIELSDRLNQGDNLKAGTTNTRGFVLTSEQASFNLSATSGNAPEMVVIADSPFIAIPVAQTGTISFSSPSGGVQRITGLPGQFTKVRPNDAAHLYNTPRKGILRVLSVSPDGSQVDFSDPNPTTGSATLDGVDTTIIFFRTEGLAQLLTLPTGASISAQTLVTAINSQALGVLAEILDSGAVKIQTTRFSGDGALGIPSLGGTAKNLGFLADNYYSNDPHTAAIESDDLSGLASKRLTVAVADNSSPFDDLQVNGSPFEFINQNTPILNYLGANSRFIRQPIEKLSSSRLRLRDNIPVPSTGLGVDLRAATLTAMEFGQSDNMVFMVDNDPTTKTFDVQMFIDGTIVGPSVPSTSQFDVQDNTGALLGSSQRWLGYRLEDYRIWFQAKGLLPSSEPNSQLRLTSVPFGPNGERIKVGLHYPLTPNSPAAAAYTVESASDEILIQVSLASGAERLIGLLPNRRVDIETTGTTVRFVFLPPVDLSTVLPGDILSLADSNYSSANQGAMRVQNISSLIDPGNAFEHVQESKTCNVTGSTSVTLTTAAVNTIRIGDKFTIGSTTRLVTAVTSQTQFTVAAPGFTNGTGLGGILDHKAITASSTPSFSILAGDRLQVGALVLKVTSVFSPTEFEVDTSFAFSGLQSGVLSRVFAEGERLSGATSESNTVQSSQSIRIFELSASGNTALAISALLNGTAGIKDLILVSNAVGSDGSGSLKESTEDELGNGERFIQLKNGEAFIYNSQASSPSLRLKEAVAVVPEIGDKVRLIPMTAQNVSDHFSKKQITGLTVAADVALVDQGRRVQVSSKVPGGFGSVYAIGGKASGQNVLAIRGIAQELNSSRAQIELDGSAIELLAPGHTIKITQAGRAKKRFTGAQPTSTTNLDIQIASPQVGLLTLGVPLVILYPYIQSGSVKWAVRRIGRKRVRYEVFSGSATLPPGLKVDDWVLVGNGDSYAGISTDQVFAPANQGWFQVRETDNLTYFDVDGEGVEEFVETTQNSLIFTSYHSARPGDQVVIGFDAPVGTNNKGTFDILEVLSTTSITYENENVSVQPSIALGLSGTSSINILDAGYSTYRKIVMLAPKPSDPTNRSLAILTPGYDMSLISEGQGARVRLPNRLSFPIDPVPGVAGYNFWTGLKRRVQRVVDGYEPDSATFPGVGAAGVSIEVREPQIQRIKLGLKVKTAKGVSLQSLSDTIKSGIAGYINSLGLGSDVILSEVVRIVQQVPGVDACVLTAPELESERITVTDSSIARISTSEITLS